MYASFMISDFQTNFVYFSGLLPHRHAQIFKDITALLKIRNLKFGILPHTHDIWCRDYMPVQVSKNKFLQFRYEPSYLKAKKWRATITDPIKICRAIGVKPKISEIVVDGGNVVRFGIKAIMTERIYSENCGYPEEVLVDILKELLKVNELIIIPEEPGDPFGHADGCVRFIDEKNVIINEPQKDNQKFNRSLRRILKNHRLSFHEVPYFIDNDPKNKDSVVGNYINYLEVGNLVVVPAYNGYDVENTKAFKAIKRVFGPRKVVESIESTAIAKQGGVLNCVSWGILK